MIRVEGRAIAALTAKLEGISKNFKRDSRRVLSTLQRRTKAEAARVCREIYNVKRARLLEDLRVTNVNPDDLSFGLVGSRKPISLVQFNARPTRSGLKVIVRKDSGRTKIPSGFFANSPENNYLPWIRKGEPRRMAKGRYRGKVRQPIHALHGPSAADMLNNAKVIEPIRTGAVDKMTAELTRMIEVALNG